MTIAIGCSLLIINVLIFAGVYYQRDKNRLSRHHHDSGSGSTDSGDRESSKHKKLLENGIPNSICGEMLRNTDIKPDPGKGEFSRLAIAAVSRQNLSGGGTFGHIHHHMHHQLPPPEFADLPPPPIKHKPIPCVVPKLDQQHFGTLPRQNSGQHRFTGGTLPRAHPSQEPPQNLHVMKSSLGPSSKSGATEMDELRV